MGKRTFGLRRLPGSLPVVVAMVMLAGGRAQAAQPPAKAAFIQTPAVATPTATPAGPGEAPGMSAVPPDNFDPDSFGALTTNTLPLENGRAVVGRANGTPIFWEDFTLQARLVGARLYERHPGKDDGIRKILATPVMDALFMQELFRQFAAANQLVVQPAERERRRAEFLRSPDPAELKMFATLTAEQANRLVDDALLREKVVKLLGDRATSATPTAENVRLFLEQGGGTTSPVTITRASHIVIRATPDMSEFNRNDAEAKAREALEKLRGGMDFTEAVQRYSQDRFTAFQGGNLGYYKTGTMYPEFEKAAALLQPGEVSDVVRTPVGFHIIKVTDRRAEDDTLWAVEKWMRLKAVEQWKREALAGARLENFLAQ